MARLFTHGPYTFQQKNALFLDSVILPLTVAYCINNYRVLLDTLCRATGTTPGITLITQYPCDTAGILSHSAFLVWQLPSTVISYVSATHFSSGPYPNEIWPLHGFCIIFSSVVVSWACVLFVCPQMFLRLRSWFWMLVSVTCTVSPFLGLLTHPNAPPGTYWTTYLPMVGVMLQCERMLFRLEGWPAIIHLASYCLVSLSSTLLLPRVYPHLSVPWWTLPLLCLSTLCSLPFMVLPSHVIPRPALPQHTKIVSAGKKESAQSSTASCKPQPEEQFSDIWDTQSTAPAHASGASSSSNSFHTGSFHPDSRPSSMLGTKARHPSRASILKALPSPFAAAQPTASVSISDNTQRLVVAAPLVVIDTAASATLAVRQPVDVGCAFFPSWELACIDSVEEAEGENSITSGTVATVPDRHVSSSRSSSGDQCTCVIGRSGSGSDPGSVGTENAAVVKDQTVTVQRTTVADSVSMAMELCTQGIIVQPFLYQPYMPPVSKAFRFRIVTKIPHMEPEQLTPDFLEKMNMSFGGHPTRPSLIVGMAVRRGCIELVMDLVSLSETATDDADLATIQKIFPDPSVWLHHLHVLPPPGTQVLTQACGSVWRSTWDTSLDPPQWVLSPFPLPTGHLPRLLMAPCVIMQAASLRLKNSSLAFKTAEPSGCPQSKLLSSVRAASPPTANIKLAASAQCAPCTANPRLQIEVSVFGIVPDVCVRCSGSYLESRSSMQPRQEATEFKSGGARTFMIDLIGPLPDRGLLMVESKLGWMVSDSTPVLLLQDADMAREVERILSFSSSGQFSDASHTPPAQCDEQIGSGRTRENRTEHHDFIVDLGSWFDFVDAMLHTAPAASSAPDAPQNRLSALQFLLRKPARSVPASHVALDTKSLYHIPAMRTHMAKIGISLLVSLVDNACPHTAASVMQGLLSLGHSYPWVLAQCERQGTSGMTLLQHTLTSGCVATRQLILNLGEENGLPWHLSSDPDSTPSWCSQGQAFAKKASAADDGGVLAHSILQEYNAACDAVFGHVDTLCRGSRLATAVVESRHPAQRRSWGGPLPTCRKSRDFIPAPGTGNSSSFDFTTGRSMSVSQHVELCGVSKLEQPAGFNTGIRRCMPQRIGSSSSSALQNVSFDRAPCRASLSVSASAELSTPGSTLTPVNVLLPEAAYHLWLARQNAVYTDQFYILISCVVLIATIRKAVDDQPVLESASLIFVVLHAVRMGGQRALPALFEKHSESQNAIWHAMRIAFKLVSVISGWHGVSGPPLPYLMFLDWIIEGVLPTLCAQVRPSTAILVLSLDALLSSCLYTRYQIISSPALAISFAVAWNLACLVLCVVLDARNRRTFVRSSTHQSFTPGGTPRFHLKSQ